MFNVSDIPNRVLRDIAGAYHRRLASTDTESQPAEERDFQRTVYLRTALEWLAMWLNDQPPPAAVPDDVAQDAAYASAGIRLRLLRDAEYLEEQGYIMRAANAREAGAIIKTFADSVLAAAQKKEGE